jgi:hypothetical protein
MKITNTDLALQSNHAALTRQQSQETLRSWRGERPDFEGMQSAMTNISDAARQLFASMAPVLPAPTFAPPSPNTTAVTSSEAQAIDAANEAVNNDPFLLMIKQMVEFLTGKEVRVFDMQSFSADMRHAEASSTTVSAATSSASSSTASNSGRAGYGVEYDYHAVYEEIEQTSFSAEGTVLTADGQTFSFQLDLQMTRQYREETNVSVRAGDAVRQDPLVVNFGGTAAQLAAQASQRFSFDLNNDGHAEALPLFTSGSGYLALDLNGNGRIDSGKELFGPQSGNGFAELARLDTDGNGWIDESDADFKNLSVWTPGSETEGSNGTLQSLAKLGIGALGLAHVASPFALRGNGNEDLGIIKASGLYLTEDGKAGNLQEIDLTV